MSMVHSSRGQNEPASNQLKSETAIVAGMASATLGDKLVPWQTLAGDYGLIRDEIAKVLPHFEDYNQNITAKRGFYLQNPAALCQWNTSTGKAMFGNDPLPQQLIGQSAQALTDLPVLTLQTLRSHDQYNTTIYGMDDRYRGVYGERKVIFVNANDMETQGLIAGDIVTISTVTTDNIVRKLDGFKVIDYQIPAGCAAAYYPETNALVPLEGVGVDSNTPAFKSIPITLKKQNR